MNKLINLFQNLHDNINNYPGYPVIHYNNEIKTFQELDNDVNAMLKQMNKYDMNRNQLCFICMDDFYLLIIAILAANKLQCNIMPFLGEDVPEINENSLPHGMIVVCDDKNYNKFELLPCEKILVDEPDPTDIDLTNKFVYGEELTYFCGGIDKQGNIYIDSENYIDDVSDFIELCKVDSNIKICMNGCQDNRLFLLQIFAAFFSKAKLFFFRKSLEYNPNEFFYTLHINHIEIVTLNSFSIEYLYKLQNYICKEAIAGIENLKKIIINQYTFDNISLKNFIDEYSGKLLKFTFLDENKFLDYNIQSMIKNEDSFMLELIIRKLITLVDYNLCDLKLNDSIGAWGVNSLNFVQIIVYLEGILQMEFQDEMLAYTSYDTFEKFIESMAKSWSEKMAIKISK